MFCILSKKLGINEKHILLLIFSVFLILLTGCAFPKKECEKEHEFNSYFNCFQENNKNGRYAYSTSFDGIDLLTEAGKGLQEGVNSGRINKEKARDLFSEAMHDINERLAPKAELLKEARIHEDHPYLQWLAQRDRILNKNNGVSESPCIYENCGSVNVRGYYRKDGTYVRPHTRSAPRSSRK